MMTLAGVENVLIKLQYIDQVQREVELLHIIMDSSATRDQGLGSASLVEECRCPIGYTGLSCENCAFGYVRQQTGAWLGRCVREEEPCRPGQYGDPKRGIPCKVNITIFRFCFCSHLAVIVSSTVTGLPLPTD